MAQMQEKFQANCRVAKVIHDTIEKLLHYPFGSHGVQADVCKVQRSLSYVVEQVMCQSS